LSRALVVRGHRVTHAYFVGDHGPKADFGCFDGGALQIIGVDIKATYDKRSFIRRRFNDVEYGRNVAACISAERPDIVISGNTPTEAQDQILRAARRSGAAFIYWVQDFYSIAASRLLARKFGILGSAVGCYYRCLEYLQFRMSDAIVVITDDFVQRARTWSGNPNKIFTIENWGAVGEVKPLPKQNEWSVVHGLNEAFVFLYSGTLALKHNPEFLITLARSWKDKPDVKIAVVAQGVGVDRLSAAKESEHLDNLLLLPLQTFGDLPAVLASADVLVAVIESTAGVFSVPSKVQSYLCARRPILLAAPKENLASRVLLRETAGLAVEPGDLTGFLSAAKRLYCDAALRGRLGQNGYAHAQRAYDLDVITNKFLDVFSFAHGTARFKDVDTSTINVVKRVGILGLLSRRKQRSANS
jgi:glycosyltransferase involved in cell wall biosynthesis